MQFNSIGMECILFAQNKYPYCNKEVEHKCFDESIKMFKEADNSRVRLVLYINKKPISGINLLIRREGFLVVLDVYTEEQYRQKGYAKKLWAEAKKHFKNIQHSYNLSEDGKAFAAKCR